MKYYYSIEFYNEFDYLFYYVNLLDGYLFLYYDKIILNY